MEVAKGCDGEGEVTGSEGGEWDSSRHGNMETFTAGYSECPY
jgi:hypothetical protein